MATRDSLLEGLNPDQRQAVEHIDGPLLIVAGPGSGKTRVITHRIAYLVRTAGISPRRICAVTFTNRAAREMKGRLERLLGPRAKQVSAGTFHALCASILRRDGEAAGIPTDFVIFDSDDQMELVKRAMEAAEIDPKKCPPRGILSAISWAKSQLLAPQDYLLTGRSYYDEIAQRVYASYQEMLQRNRALDFDDLLSKTVGLLRQVPEARAKYQERFIHLLVDEFQDTNIAQYQLARELAGKHLNICVVGDPDQSIYSWRNADLRNILSFQKDYPKATVINLDQSYRSTKTILEAARQLITANTKRLNQELWTENAQGQPIVVSEAYNEEEEAQLVLQEVRDLCDSEGYHLRDCVVAYRVNAQSRALEEACLRYGVPYKLIGGVRFYQRREVKDILAYLRLIQDPYDEVSLTRVINVPPRGIGKRTVDDLARRASSLSLPMYAALQSLAESDEAGPTPANSLGQRQTQALADFLRLLNGLMDAASSMDLPHLVEEVMDRTGYRRHLLESDEPDAEERLDNLRELQGVAADHADSPARETLPAFLQSAALMSDQDALTEDEQDYLTLITLHQIKGLEYPVVFIVGMEEHLLPHVRSMDAADQLEEERRLAYVGMTRAKERLYLFRAFRRRLMGMGQPNFPSRFLSEVPEHLLARRGREKVGAGTVAYDRWSTPSSDASPAPSSPPFKTGQKVVHAHFGQGIVVECRPTGADFEITVAFKGDSGIKRLLHSFANLQEQGQAMP